MTPEMPRVGRDGTESDRPTMAEVAELVGESDGALLLAILETDATRAQIEAAVAEERASGPAGEAARLGGRAGRVLELLRRHDLPGGPEGPGTGS